MEEVKDRSSSNHSWRIKYILIDYVTASLSWMVFFIYRKVNEIPTEYFEWTDIWQDRMLYIGMILIPLGWLFLYYATSQYDNVHRQSRLLISFKTLLQSIVGGLVLLFTILVDDDLLLYKSYLHSFIILVFLHFTLTILFRILFLTILKNRIKNGKISFSTLIVGISDKGNDVLADIDKVPTWGFDVVGLFDEKKGEFLEKKTNKREKISLMEAVENLKIQELIFLNIENSAEVIQSFFNNLYPKVGVVNMYISADDNLTMPNVNLKPIPKTEILEVEFHKMAKWEEIIKRIFDVIISILSLVVLSPLILWICFKIKMSSPGPIFFKQKRQGLQGKSFDIIKFRSMYVDSEENGPRLSYEGDRRCTPFGAWMRKWRIDEIPQFINVILGHMSLVGPRPERKYYMNQLVQKEPRYNYLLTVRPGITSLGQVKYGYASDLQQMQKRLKFDLLYLDNRSLGLDIKILFHTLLVLLQGKGK